MSGKFPHPYRRQDAVTWIQKATRQAPETDFAIASATEAIGGIAWSFKAVYIILQPPWDSRWANPTGVRAAVLEPWERRQDTPFQVLT